MYNVSFISHPMKQKFPAEETKVSRGRNKSFKRINYIETKSIKRIIALKQKVFLKKTFIFQFFGLIQNTSISITLSCLQTIASVLLKTVSGECSIHLAFARNISKFIYKLNKIQTTSWPCAPPKKSSYFRYQPTLLLINSPESYTGRITDTHIPGKSFRFRLSLYNQRT